MMISLQSWSRMMNQAHFFFFLIVLILLPKFSEGCFWDRDTLAHEHKLAPGVFDVISGNFARRSQIVYTLRVQNRPKQLTDQGFGWLFSELPELKEDSNLRKKLDIQALRWTDDLAVAFDRLQQHDKGIKLLKQVLTQYPDRYETHANLGTLLIHSASFPEGLIHLKKAVEINPQAHFGREKIQIALVEYIIAQRAVDQPKFPLSRQCIQALPIMIDPWLKDLPQAQWGARLYRPKRKGESPYIEPGGKEWMCLVMPQAHSAPAQSCRGFCGALTAQNIEIKDGINGILGMMRFSTHTHPILLEALADLLLAKGYQGPNRFAAMAYLQASRSPQLDTQAQSAYEALAALSLVGHRFGLSQIEQTLNQALKKGQKLQDRIHRDESSWSRRGEQYLERRYAQRYLKHKR